jgi:hypothetical protein
MPNLSKWLLALALLAPGSAPALHGGGKGEATCLVNLTEPCLVTWTGKAESIELQHVDGSRGLALGGPQGVPMANSGNQPGYCLRRLVIKGKAFQGDLSFAFRGGKVRYTCHLVGDASKGRLTVKKGPLVGATPQEAAVTHADLKGQPLIQVEFR